VVTTEEEEREVCWRGGMLLTEWMVYLSNVVRALILGYYIFKWTG